MSDELIGATIVSVRESDWGGTVILGLADGREVRLVAHSYEDASIDVTVLSPEERRREAARAQGVREVERVRRLERMTRPPVRMSEASAMLKDVFMSPLLEALRADMNRQSFLGGA